MLDSQSQLIDVHGCFFGLADTEFSLLDKALRHSFGTNYSAFNSRFILVTSYFAYSLCWTWSLRSSFLLCCSLCCNQSLLCQANLWIDSPVKCQTQPLFTVFGKAWSTHSSMQPVTWWCWFSQHVRFTTWSTTRDQPWFAVIPYTETQT